MQERNAQLEQTVGWWLGIAYKWLMPIALAGAIGVAAVTVISASSDGDGHRDGQRWSAGTDEDKEVSGAECRTGGRGLSRWSGIAELVGTDREGLKTALSEGQTLAAIAEEHGVAAQSVIDALVEAANERIDAWVAAGKLSEEEAETKRSEAATRIEALVNDGVDGDDAGRWGKSRGRGQGRGFGGRVGQS